MQSTVAFSMMLAGLACDSLPLRGQCRILTDFPFHPDCTAGRTPRRLEVGRTL